MYISHACVYILLHRDAKKCSPFSIFLLQSKHWGLLGLTIEPLQTFTADFSAVIYTKNLGIGGGSTYIFWKTSLFRCSPTFSNFIFTSIIHGKIEGLRSKWQTIPMSCGSKKPVSEIHLTSLLSWKGESSGSLLSRASLLFKLWSG